MSESLLGSAKAHAKLITRWRRNLHKIPETGLFLPQTAAYVRSCLDEMGIPYRVYEDHSGICGILGDVNKGRCVALRADMDALPIAEQTGLAFRSSNGNMHACGHDAHTAMLLGAARVLKDICYDLPGCVKLIFQPGEETGDGAKSLIRGGVLENPKVDAMIALHIDRTSSSTVSMGDIIVKRGPMHASNDEFEITIKGCGGHGGYPHRTVDPISCAGILISTIQMIVSRETDPSAAAVISFGSVQTSSNATNVIPESAVLSGTIRCGKQSIRAFIKQRLQEIAKGVCAAMRADCEVRVRCGEPPVENDDRIADIVENAAISLLGADRVHSLREQVMGSEDAGYYFQEIPGCLFRFCNPLPSSDGIIHPLHSSKMMLDDSKLYLGSALLAQSAVDCLQASAE